MTDLSVSVSLKTCLVCNTPLAAYQARNSTLCERRECNWQYSLLRRQRRLCKICARPLTLDEVAGQLCARAECRRAAVRDIAERVYQRNQLRSAALIQQENEQAQQLYDRVTHTFALASPQFFPLVVIPAYKARIVSLSKDRRHRFRKHLSALINQALLPAEDTTADQQPCPETSPVTARRPNAQVAMGLACSQCQGLCCTGGADHAYLQVETIRRYSADHPQHRPADILAAYLHHLSPRSYEGSCIFHQSDGCGLPRTLRADLCNRHYCKALQQFQQNLPDVGPVRAFFVAAHNGAVESAALVHDEQMLIVETKTLHAQKPADE